MSVQGKPCTLIVVNRLNLGAIDDLVSRLGLESLLRGVGPPVSFILAIRIRSSLNRW
jgi:hypothetical protein